MRGARAAPSRLLFPMLDDVPTYFVTPSGPWPRCHFIRFLLDYLGKVGPPAAQPGPFSSHADPDVELDLFADRLLAPGRV